MAKKFKLTEEQRTRVYPSGKNVPIFYDRVHWARSDLVNAGLLRQVERGTFQITERGISVLKENPPTIDRSYLKHFPEFEEYLRRSRAKKDSKPEEEITRTKTDLEIFEESYKVIRDRLEAELLARLKRIPPSFFERVVLDLLQKMGYGGEIKDAGMVTGKSGDEGIDGVIKEDPLGLDVICYQAKRFDRLVPSQEVRNFAGSLGKRTHKGVFVTTSSFSTDTNEWVKNTTDKRIILIDGKELVRLMIEHNVGVTVDNDPYYIKKLDADYFNFGT